MHSISLSRRWLLLPLIVAVTAVISFACFYLFHDHAELLRWYYRLNDCFYRRADFNERFFNEATKAKGNKWCLAAILFSLAAIIYVAYRWKRSSPKAILIIPLNAQTAGIHLLLWAAGTTLWLYANAYLLPGTDEVFSAVHCAAVHPFQAVSYYMLPNNHLLFNLLNNLLFPSGADHVFTGRLLSLAACLLFLSAAFYFLHQRFDRWLPAFVTTIMLAMQLPVWGFAAQARGYELYLLASWLTFIAVYNYHLRSRSGKWALVFLLGWFVGFCVLPSFLYWAVSVLLFAAILQLAQRKADLRFWKYVLVGTLLVFFFYLPALCFSGAAAFSENRYVTAAAVSAPVFLMDFYTTFLYFLKSHYLGEWKWDYWLCYGLFLAPLLLLLRRRSGSIYSGLFFCLVWAIFIGMAFAMKRYPFPRNLIAHFSISLAFTCCAFYLLIDAIGQRLKVPRLIPAVYSLAGILACVYLVVSFKETAASSLYGNNVNDTYNQEVASLKSIPAGSSVGCSDANFMFYYLLRKKGCIVNKCAPGQEQFLIRHQEEIFPEDVMRHYTFNEQVGEFMFYRHR